MARAQGVIYFPVILKGNGMAGLKGSLGLVTAYGSYNHVFNPSAEIDGNYAAVLGTVTRSTIVQKYGLYSYEVQSTGNGDGIDFDLYQLENSPYMMTARIHRPSSQPSRFQFALGATFREARMLEKIDDNWELWGLEFSEAQAAGQLTATIYQLGPGTPTFYVDGVQVEPYVDGNGYTTYIDGTQEGCRWLGAPHASRSQRSAESKAGGVVKDFYKEYGFFVERIIGAGTASQANQIDSYAQLPGGELNQIKVQSREFVVQGWFLADTEESLHENIQALELALSHDAHPGDQPNKIRFSGSKVQKEISAYYKGGLEGDLAAFYDRFSVEDDEWKFNAKFREKAAIQFDAPDPSWYEVGESAVVMDTNDTATFRTIAGRILNPTDWSNLGPPNAAGTYTDVRVIAEDATYLYIGGNFLNFDNIAAADYIVRYNKETGVYSAMAALNGIVYAIAIAPNGDVYIGGAFTNASGVAAADYIAVWAVGASAFAAVGTPVSGAAAITRVEDLLFDGAGRLYISGVFDNWANIANADNIVMWDTSSSTYSALSTGLNTNVTGLALGADKSTIYIIGPFVAPGNRIVSWDGSSLTEVGTSPFTNQVYSIVTDPVTGIIYVGSAVDGIQSFDGAAWTRLPDPDEWWAAGGASGPASMAIGPDGTLYVGGVNSAGSSNKAIRWNGYAWSPLDIILPGTPDVWAIYVSKYTDPVVSNIYAIYLGFSTSGSGSFASDQNVTNEGSWPAYPQIIINRSGGDGATIQSIRNERTGLTLLCDYDLLDGETVTIDLNPSNRKETSSFFGPVAVVLPNSNMSQWNLLAGDNQVSMFVSESGTPTVLAYLLWRDAYRSWN